MKASNKSGIFFMVIFMMMITIGYSQITINQSDMPSPGDTVRTSIALPAPTIDFVSSGANFQWNFIDLAPAVQRLDTFKTIQQTPVFFWPTFFTVANMAMGFDPGQLIPGLEFEKAFQFIQKNSTSYSDYGYGLIIQGLPLPLRFTTPDVLFTFPMTYQQTNSSDASLAFLLPDIGYLAIERNRQNTVDGWGTLTTPYGSFETLRLKSEVFEMDSVYVDSTGQGYAIERNYTEYKWLAKNHKIPILTVIEDNFLGTTIIYKDSIRDLTVGKPEWDANSVINIYPNPFEDQVWLELCKFPDPMVVRLAGLDGYIVFSQQFNESTVDCRKILLELPVGLKPGVYLLQFLSNHKTLTYKVLKN